MLNRCRNILSIRRLIQNQITCYSSQSENIITNSKLKSTEKQTIKNDEKQYKQTIKNDDKQYKQLFQKNDPDSFGTLTTSATNLENETEMDEGDIKEEKYLENINTPRKKLRTKQYADIIKAYIRKRQIKEAIDVMEIMMIKEDRVKPEAYIYNLLMGACGRVGYTKKGFKLFNDMKKRALSPTNGTYTALFNACANSPWVEDGLSRATQLRQLVVEKGVILNETNYNAMIKAFGRCGDLQTAFNLVDEMIEKRIPVKEDTLNFLLQSCITDKNAGFRHALLVWRKYYKKGVNANIFSFNLMLKCIKDCNLGDAKVMDNLLKSPEFQLLDNKPMPALEHNKISPDFELIDTLNNDKSQIFNKIQSDFEFNNIPNRPAMPLVHNEISRDTLNDKSQIFNKSKSDNELNNTQTTLENKNKSLDIQLSDDKDSQKRTKTKLTTSIENELTNKMNASYWPNLMAVKPHLGTMLKLEDITKSEHRLLLVGGFSGFLETMKYFHVTPDIKTFTMLLDCIPGTITAEKALLAAMKTEGVKVDVDFLNMLIKKRSMRFDYENAKDVMTMFKSPKLRPDVVTYGILALGCTTKEQAEHLIKEMTDAGYRMNIEILGPMLKQGCIRLNFKYVLEIMELAQTEQIKPNKMFIQHLEDFYKRCKVESLEKKGNFFTTGFRLFRMRYKSWLKEIEMEPNENVHPWQQFREKTESNVKNYKDTETHFKPRLSSRYRQKTSTKNRY